MKNWDIENFRLCAKISRILNLKFKIFISGKLGAPALSGKFGAFI